MSAKILPQVFASISATLGGFALGTVLGWSSPATELIKKKLTMSDDDISWIGSITTLGAATAMFPMPFLIDSMGRKMTMLLIAPPFCIFWIVLAVAKSMPMFLVGRFFTGFCGGAFCVVVPVYIGEVTQANCRGGLAVCFQLLLVFGILFSYAVGCLDSLLVLGIACAVVLILFFVLMLFMPETPTFLVMKKRTEKYEATYHFLRGSAYDYKPELAELEKSCAEAEAHKQGGIWNKFKQKTCVKAFCMCVLLQTGQQLSGINSVIFYAQHIFTLAGSTLSPNVSAIVLGVVQVFATFVSVALVDKAGRKLLMMISLIIMAICLFVLGWYFYEFKKDEEYAKGLAWIPLLSVCAYLLGFSLGTGPLPWVMLGELFSNDVKGVASSVCAFLNWSLAFVVTKTFPRFLSSLGETMTFVVFAIICIVTAVLIWIFVLETKNKTLDQIQKELE